MSSIESSILNSNQSENNSKREIVTLDIEGKNYEVIKTHFTYPEYIQKENGGVEGYDRFQLSWDSFEKEKLDLLNRQIEDNKEFDDNKKLLIEKQRKLQYILTVELNKISEKLGIGTEQKESTISHYTNAVDGKKSYEWNENKFFLNKPFDLKDVLNHLREYKKSPTNTLRYGLIDRKIEDFSLIDELKKRGFSENDLQNLYVSRDNTFILEREDIETAISGNPTFIDLLEEIVNDKDVVLCGASGAGMSFAQGSQLSSQSVIDGNSMHQEYSSAFFNFNDRNSAFADYKKNLDMYKEEFGEKIDNDIGIRIQGSDRFHPTLSMVFTEDFPAFNWAMADTAYVPMKEGPNFFRFYSKDVNK